MCAPSASPAVGEFQSPDDTETTGTCSQRLEELQPGDRLADSRSADNSANTEITHDKLMNVMKEVKTAYAPIPLSPADPASS